ncbi:MAG: M23 family metallopeptidase [Acidobacteria bacterium]|nr:M23 family metallopeptidase [Acidobacteriota bacterium]
MKLTNKLGYALVSFLLFGGMLLSRPVEGQGIGGITTPTPPVIVNVEPEEDGKVVYAPIAPGTSDNSGSDDGAHLALKLLVTNQGGSTLHLKTTVVTFAGPPFAAGAVFNTDKQIEPWKTVEVHLQNNVAIPGENFNFQLSYPPPPIVIIKLKFIGYNEPYSLSRSLAAHRNAPPLGAYLFPGKVADLNRGEFWSGRSNSITTLHGNDQRFAYDLGVGKWDSTLNDWTDKKPGADGSKNEDYLVWEKPIYAGATGVVEDVIRDNPDHEPGGDGSGNKIVIRIGDELLGYFHLRQNSVPAYLVPGTAVAAGQFIGRVGDSGAASHPHLHMHCVKLPAGETSSHLRPILFRGIKLVERTELDPNNFAAAPWVPLVIAGKSLPWTRIAIWPALTVPGTY